MTKQIVESVNNYKIIHNLPVLNEKEREEKKRDILIKIYYKLSNGN